MQTNHNPWDDDYLRRGRLWGGSAGSLPRLPHSSHILELGCGDGKTISSILKDDCTVTAIDFSSCAASLCLSAFTDRDRVRILIADIRQTPFRDESFDVIIASHIAGHLSVFGRQHLAKEVLRLLTSGGMLCFRDFSIGDFRYGRGEETEPGTFLRKNGISTHYFTSEELRSLFTGFTVRSLEQHCWEMQVRGRGLPRAEIVGEFQKPA
jgi:cyclopropane fatty-acyl-phospholipid synthase-like methyltransferase